MAQTPFPDQATHMVVVYSKVTIGPFHDISKRLVFDTHSHNNLVWIVVKELRCVNTDQSYINNVKLIYDEIIPVWLSLSHDHILLSLGIYCDKGSHPTVAVPYCANGNILDYNMRPGNPDKKLQIMQIASGLSYLHSKDVSHGNINPANILIGDDGRVCISDACLNFRLRQLIYDTSSYQPIPASYQYKPPEELLDPSEISHKGDVYSWASVVYAVFSGKQPYHGLHHGRGVFKIICSGHRTLDMPPEITPQLWSILLQCWTLKPEDRPSMHEVESMLYDLE